MIKKKVITFAVSSVLATALLAGVTYAWFTNTQEQSIGKITAGKLGIELEVVSSPGTSPAPIYPQLTLVDEDTGMEYPDPDGDPLDNATTVFSLTNDSSRQVLVRISGGEVLRNGIMGSETDRETGNVLNPGTLVPLTDTSAVRVNYDFGDDTVAYFAHDNAYIYLATGTSETDITVTAWIDGETGDNTYQFATIEFNGMTAKAVQYRKAAFLAEFPELDADELDEIESAFGLYE